MTKIHPIDQFHVDAHPRGARDFSIWWYFFLVNKVNSTLKGLNDAKDLLYIFQFISITPMGRAHEWLGEFLSILPMVCHCETVKVWHWKITHLLTHQGFILYFLRQELSKTANALLQKMYNSCHLSRWTVKIWLWKISHLLTHIYTQI